MILTIFVTDACALRTFGGVSFSLVNICDSIWRRVPAAILSRKY